MSMYSWLVYFFGAFCLTFAFAWPSCLSTSLFSFRFSFLDGTRTVCMKHNACHFAWERTGIAR